RDLSTEFRIANDTDEFFHVDGREFCIFSETFRNDDSVFVVGTEPRQERDTHVLTDSELTTDRGRGVSEHGSLLDLLADRNDRALVERGEAVGAREIDEAVFFGLAVVVLYFDGTRIRIGNLS